VQLGSSHSVQEGISVGERAAAAILAARAGDGADVTPTPYAPQPGPGEYQLTPPTFAPAAFTQVARVTPFALPRARQFRSAPPPALTSERYARDFAQVEALGERSSTVRTAEQTTIGKFWGAAPIWIVWNQIAQQAGLAFGNSLAANARMFAVLDTTLADSAIALYDAKYAYHRWRPVTAITAVDQGNPKTVSNPAWLPLANTAPDPSYPGAHAAFSRAAATVLQAFFGTNHDVFSLTNATSGITRHFEGFSQAASEASASRVFAGQHFAYDEVAGQALGREVAEFDVSKLLRPRGR
jgi:membrane-associated phospholipid phosphatase